MSRFLTTSNTEAEKEHKIQFLQRNLSTERLFYWLRAANCLYQEPSELQPRAKDRPPDSRALVIFLQLAVIFSLCITGEIIYERYCPFDGNRVLQPRAAEKAPTHHIRFRLTINWLWRTSGVQKKKKMYRLHIWKISTMCEKRRDGPAKRNPCKPPVEEDSPANSWEAGQLCHFQLKRINSSSVQAHRNGAC